jgi:hypothetical protein
MSDMCTLTCCKFSPLAKSKTVEVPRGSPLGALNQDVWHRKRLSKGNTRFASEEDEVIGPGQYVRLLQC